MKKSILKPTFISILVFQIAYILFINFTRSENLIDFDSGAALRHAIEIWRNGTLFLKNYSPVSTLEIDCTSFWAAPIFLATGSLGLSYAVIHAVLLVFILCLSNAVLKISGVGADLRSATLCLLLVPYSFGQLEYFNMLFISAGQYNFKIITLLYITYFYLADIKKIKRPILLLNLSAFAFFLSVTTLSSGVYVLFMLIAPFMLAEVIQCINKQSISLKSFRNFFLIGTVMLTAVLIKFRSMHFTPNQVNGSLLCEAGRFADNVLDCLTGIYILMGGIPKHGEVRVATVDGILHITRFIFLTAMICITFRTLKRENSWFKSRFNTACISILLCNLLVLIISSTTYGGSVFEYRYHITWMILFIFLSVNCLEKFLSQLKNIWFKNLLLFALPAFILCNSAVNFRYISHLKPIEKDGATQIAEYADAQNVSTVLMYKVPDTNSIPQIINAIRPDMECFSLNDNWDGVQFFDYYCLDFDEVISREHILLICKSDFNKLTDGIRGQYTYQTEIYGVSCYLKYQQHQPRPAF